MKEAKRAEKRIQRWKRKVGGKKKVSQEAEKTSKLDVTRRKKTEEERKERRKSRKAKKKGKEGEEGSDEAAQQGEKKV